MNNKDVYRCYSEQLKTYLLNNNVQYFLVARDIVSNKKFYAFEKNKQFLSILEQWNINNPRNKS